MSPLEAARALDDRVSALTRAFAGGALILDSDALRRHLREHGIAVGFKWIEQTVHQLGFHHRARHLGDEAFIYSRRHPDWPVALDQALVVTAAIAEPQA